MHVERPAPAETVVGPFRVSGWALDQSAGGGTGIDVVDVWAFPVTGAPVYLGGAAIGGSRPDVAAVFGPGFTLAGFNLVVNATLRPGQYTLQVFARRIATGTFDIVDLVPINVGGTTLSDLVPCTAGQVPRFNGNTWDCADSSGSTGPTGPAGPAGAAGATGPAGPPSLPCAACVDNASVQTLTAVGKVANSATTATSANTASAIVTRDAAGNFVANTIDLSLIRYPSTDPAALTTLVQSTGGVSFLRAGSTNFLIGDRAGQSIAGGNTGNTGVGRQALVSTVNGSNNTAVGNTAGAGLNGSNNVALGTLSMGSAIVTGSNNVAVGARALTNAAGASANNIALGSDAGQQLVNGSDNIYISNNGASENGTIRIGAAPTQTRAFMAGVRGVNTAVADAVAVLIDSTGQLGTVSSSRRFKHDILDLGDATSKLYDLRPVSFRYLPSLDTSQTRTYGLIAEEVAAVMPDLIAHDRNGEIETVKYQLLAPLLLNEVQRLKRALDASATREAELAKALAALTARLDALEKR